MRANHQFQTWKPQFGSSMFCLISIFLVFLHQIYSFLSPPSLAHSLDPSAYILDISHQWLPTTPLSSTRISLPPESFHALNYPVHSRKLQVFGQKSKLVHARINQINVTTNVDSDESDSSFRQFEGLSPILDVFNSSLSLQNLHIDSGIGLTCVAFIGDSIVQLSGCSILSSHLTSPLVVTQSTLESDTTVTIVDCDHKSNPLDWSLLPLVGMSTQRFPFTSRHKTHQLNKQTFKMSSLVVSGTGLSFNSTKFPLGTGPLFDFGVLSPVNLASVIECSIVLDSCDLLNTSSIPPRSSFVPLCPHLSQRLIGCSLKHTPNHLTGTSGMRLDVASEILMSNSSFSDSVTTPDDERDPESNVDIVVPETPTGLPSVEFSSGSRTTQLLLKASTTATQLWVDSCAFSDITVTTTTGGALRVYDPSIPVCIKHSSFTNCHSTTSTGAGGVYVGIQSTSSLAQKITFFQYQNTYAGNTGFKGPGHCYSQWFNIIVAECTFTGSNTDKEQPNQPSGVSLNRPGDIVVQNSTFGQNSGKMVGGLSLQMNVDPTHIILSSVLFFENQYIGTTLRQSITDLVIQGTAYTYEASDLYSTSTSPRCGSENAVKVFPEIVAPAILEVKFNEVINSEQNGYCIEMEFLGKFPNTNRRYDVVYKSNLSGKLYTLTGVTFDSTKSTKHTFNFMNPSDPDGLSPRTSYRLVDVKKSETQSTSNDFDVGTGTEPDWLFWHFETYSSGADSLYGWTMFIPYSATLTAVTVELDAMNEKIAVLNLTVDRIVNGVFSLLVFDTSDESKTPIDLGVVEYTVSSTPSTKSMDVGISVSGSHLQYGHIYQVISLSSPTFIIKPYSLHFTTQSLLQSASCEFDRTNTTSLSLTVRGIRFPPGKTFTLTIVEVDGSNEEIGLPFDLTDSFVPAETDETALSSHTFPTQTHPSPLQHGKRYEITHFVVVSAPHGVQKRVIFTTPTVPVRSTMIVSKHNGSEEPECGTVTSPCASIKTGWDHAGSGEETDAIQMKIDREASCGGWISVGRRALEMRCLWNRKDRLMVEDTVEGSRSTQAVFVVDGGHISISDIVVLLPSFALSFSSLHPRFLIGGWGDCVVSAVRLSSYEGEGVGMGLVCMTRGTCTIDSVSLDHITFSDSVTLISTCANNSEFHLAISHFVSSTVSTQNASLIAFASKNGLSGFSMTDSELLWTVQKVGSPLSTALIDVSTPQTHVEIVRCTFFESGCVSERSIRLGWTLSIVLVRTEPLARRSVVDLLSCLVIDCCGLDSSSQNGAVVVDCGEGVTRLNLCGSWFEETTATSPPFERDGDGRLVLSKNRKIVFSSSQSAGAVVVANRIVPTIRRTGSAFSNCRLVLKNKL
ncbi:hypothetical protein BLNAU_14560 [Blattamonas nauphoetae]|uniref:Uncharacterized protein n=1 Tax=Blattamonas nauphoetae TaxID=2049346 RepID=A0ABQ9XII9_9EUKA|nr:hypothetical protein BLNAU_14560 [Blattamonas nauphoetae]